ncbi:hypothetical protein P9Z46_15810 [Bacillus tropicus]|nr:hypothetical protein [Bacillus tropicus]
MKCPVFLSNIQLQRLEWSVASRLPTRKKAPLCQKLQPSPILSEPLLLLKLKRQKQVVAK